MSFFKGSHNTQTRQSYVHVILACRTGVHSLLIRLVPKSATLMSLTSGLISCNAKKTRGNSSQNPTGRRSRRAVSRWSGYFLREAQLPGDLRALRILQSDPRSLPYSRTLLRFHPRVCSGPFLRSHRAVLQLTWSREPCRVKRKSSTFSTKVKRRLLPRCRDSIAQPWRLSPGP